MQSIEEGLTFTSIQVLSHVMTACFLSFPSHYQTCVLRQAAVTSVKFTVQRRLQAEFTV